MMYFRSSNVDLGLRKAMVQFINRHRRDLLLVGNKLQLTCLAGATEATKRGQANAVADAKADGACLAMLSGAAELLQHTGAFIFGGMRHGRGGAL